MFCMYKIELILTAVSYTAPNESAVVRITMQRHAKISNSVQKVNSTQQKHKP